MIQLHHTPIAAPSRALMVMQLSTCPRHSSSRQLSCLFVLQRVAVVQTPDIHTKLDVATQEWFQVPWTKNTSFVLTNFPPKQVPELASSCPITLSGLCSCTRLSWTDRICFQILGYGHMVNTLEWCACLGVALLEGLLSLATGI